MFELMLFCALDMGFQNAGTAAVVVYIASLAICWIRKRFGEANISSKTLVDKHFLI